MKRSYLLGIDIGTYSSKGAIVTADGVVVAAHSVDHALSNPAPGRFEHDADGVWWHDFVAIVRALLSRSGIEPERIACIATSAIGSCVLALDEAGKPLRPAILYGIDTRATGEIAYIEDQLGREAIAARGGARLTSQASGPKILWIRNHEPEVYRNARWFLTSQAYLVYRLTGVPSIDIYTAAGFAPLFDSATRGWDERAAAFITDIERLPVPRWSCEIAGNVTERASRETGLPVGVPVIVGTTDAAAEAVSAGVAETGDTLTMFGSSIFFVTKSEQLVRSDRFWTSDFLEPGTHAFCGGMSTAGSLTTWFRDRFAPREIDVEHAGGASAYAALAALAAESPPGARQLVALPYFEGERTPLHDPRARGALFGLKLAHGRADIYRAVLEGVAYGIRHNFEAMQAEGLRPARILAAGGGTHNTLWMELVADIAAVELTIPEQQLGACYGDAFMAGVAVGLFRDLSEVERWTRPARVVTPNTAHRRVYDATYGVFRRLYEQSNDLMHELSELEQRMERIQT